jgi:helix-turn-helix protein
LTAAKKREPIEATLRSQWRRALVRSLPALSLSPRARLVGHVLTDYMDVNGVCYPSLRTIRNGTGGTVETVAAALRDLEDRGWLTVDRTVGGRGHVNRYKATVPADKQSGQPTLPAELTLPGKSRIFPAKESAEPTGSRRSRKIKEEGQDLKRRGEGKAATTDPLSVALGRWEGTGLEGQVQGVLMWLVERGGKREQVLVYGNLVEVSGRLRSRHDRDGELPTQQAAEEVWVELVAESAVTLGSFGGGR